MNSGLNGLWIPGTVTVSGPLNFVTIEQLVDLLLDNKEIDKIDLIKTSHIDYIAMLTLKDLLAIDEQASEDVDNDQSHEKDDQSHDNDDVIDEPGNSRLESKSFYRLTVQMHFKTFYLMQIFLLWTIILNKKKIFNSCVEFCQFLT